QQDILSKRFYLGQTQTEIAKELGISQAQISRLEKSAIKTIRDGMEQDI
ncbi:helix-turn-helix domain-containing protein, partial [Microvirga sp. 3-52]|nr:helix-turn-helix domain-containing protein [Microvirga sp. 3-52]